MSNNPISSLYSTLTLSRPSAGSPTEPTSTSTKRKSSRTKKGGHTSTIYNDSRRANTFPDTSAGASSTGRRAKKANSTKDSEVSLKQEEEKATPPVEPSAASPEGTGEHDDEDEDEDIARDYEEDEDDDDPFGGFGGGPPHGLSSTLRALSGMMSGVATKLRDILNNLKQKDDPSVQLIALQELSEILLISTEDNLSGHFSPDAFVKELVALMQPSEFGEENPEMMLLACRCIANLMEALPASIANVVYGGAVPILCQKLLEINYIDLAEQALSVSCILQNQELLPLTFPRPSRRSLSTTQQQSYGKAASQLVSHIWTFLLQVLSEQPSSLLPIAAATFLRILSM